MRYSTFFFFGVTEQPVLIALRNRVPVGLLLHTAYKYFDDNVVAQY